MTASADPFRRAGEAQVGLVGDVDGADAGEGRTPRAGIVPVEGRRARAGPDPDGDAEGGELLDDSAAGLAVAAEDCGDLVVWLLLVMGPSKAAVCGRSMADKPRSM